MEAPNLFRTCLLPNLSLCLIKLYSTLAVQFQRIITALTAAGADPKDAICSGLELRPLLGLAAV